MGLSDQEITIKITLDSEGAVKGFEQLGEQFQQIKSEAENTTGGFSKFQSGLLSINAAIGIASTAFGVLKGAFNSAIEVAQRGDTFNDVADAFTRLSEKAGTTSEVLLGQLKTATTGAISNLDLMKIANEALIKGLKPDLFDDVAQAANRYAQATGQSAKSSLERFVNAIAIGNERQLKQLGIFRDGKIVIEKYSDALTAQIKAQKGLGDSVEDSNASIADFSDKMASAVDSSKALKELFLELNGAIRSVTDTFAEWTAELLKAIDNSLPRLKKDLNQATLGFKLLGNVIGQISRGEFPSFDKAIADLKGTQTEGVEGLANATADLVVNVTAARPPVEQLTIAIEKHKKSLDGIKYGEIFGPGNDTGIREFNQRVEEESNRLNSALTQAGLDAAAAFAAAFTSGETLHGEDFAGIASGTIGGISDAFAPGTGQLAEIISNKLITEIFDIGKRNAEGKARDDADKFFAELFNANRLSVVIDGQLKQINDLVFGRGTSLFADGSFDDFLATLSGPVQEGFLGVGRAFNEILGNADNLGGQLAAIFANNVGGSLNNLQLLVQSTGKSFEELGSAVEKAFLDGKLSALEAQSAFTGLANVAQKGIPDALGATVQAFENLTAAGIQGGRASVDALQDLASEALELGFTTLPQLQQNLLASGKFTQESIQQLFDKLAADGITTLQGLQDISNRTAIDVIAGLAQSDFPFEQTATRVEDLLNKIDQIPDDKEITFKVRTEFDQNTKIAIDKGFVPITSEGPGLADR